MAYRGRVQLQFAASHRVIGSGEASLDESDDVGLPWKGHIDLDDVVDTRILEQRTALGELYELKLEGIDGTPRISAVVRHVDKMRISVVGRDQLPEAPPSSASE